MQKILIISHTYLRQSAEEYYDKPLKASSLEEAFKTLGIDENLPEWNYRLLTVGEMLSDFNNGKISSIENLFMIEGDFLKDKGEKTKLSLEIIESYGFPKKSKPTNYDDITNYYTLPNGIELGCLTVCGFEITDCDSLEGMDGWIYIESKEELDELVGMSYTQVCEKLARENDDFDINEYL